LSLGRRFERIEEGLLIVALVLLALLPLVDAFGRSLGGLHVPGSAAFVQQLTLWLAFVGGLLATGRGQHLTLSTAELFGQSRARKLGGALAAAVSAATAALLAYASVGVVLANREQGRVLAGGLPEWVSECAMPLSLGLMAVGFAFRAPGGAGTKALALLAIPVAFALGLLPPTTLPAGFMALLILAALVLGAPVFVGMGAFALLFFFRDGTPIAAVTAEVYRLVSSPTLPAIPLLTACGYVLAESGASLRLLRFFRSLLGFLPGALAVTVTVVLALFTIVGSGITIIAIGGIVYPMLRDDGYPEGFSLGLVTAAGGLGLLFPPSLPVILYSVVAGSREHNVPLDQLYLAGFLPGLLMVSMVVVYSVIVGRRKSRQAFSAREALAATWSAKWELLLPVLLIGLFASGGTSLLETAAAALLYVVLVECFVTRDLPLRRGLPSTLARSATLTGAVLILLSAAMGITSYVVDAQMPEQIVGFVHTHVHSRFAFLLALNALLLVVGSLVEMFAAIVALAPLVVPVGAAFGVHPLHLGVIFLANLEAGFLLPPFGLNLFLSSSRFSKPLTEVTRHALPFLLIMAVGVLLITYVPELSLGILRALGKYEAVAAPAF
jgi:C4-dicarboxylate transporter, DctM subunit